MAKTVADLEQEIKGRRDILSSAAAQFLSKTVKSSLEREIESDRKRIAEILANQVKLGDGTFAKEGQTIFGYRLPQIGPDGSVVSYALYARTVQACKKDMAGIGYVSFQKAEKKFQRLTWYEASRFFVDRDDAKLAIVEKLEKAREEAQRVLAQSDELLSFVDAHDPTIVDLADEEEFSDSLATV